MAKQKKPEGNKRHGGGHLEKDWRVAAHQRAATAYEHEILRRTLRPLGCAELFDDLEKPLTTSSFNKHPLLQAHYTLHLEVGFSIDLKPLSKGQIRLLFDMDRLLTDLKSTAFYKYCAWPTSFHADEDQRGFAVIFANTGTESLIVHNRPDLSEGPPLASTRLRNGCSVQVHWFEPFIADVADNCRIRFAEDGSKLMDRIESNYPFRQVFWEDWARRLP